MNLYVFRGAGGDLAVKAPSLTEATECVLDALQIRLLRVVENMPVPVTVGDTTVTPLTVSRNTKILPLNRGICKAGASNG